MAYFDPPLPSPSHRLADWLLLCRTVSFGDTDAAGVLHYLQLLRWCHKPYEESPERFGVASGAIFTGPGLILAVVLPEIHVRDNYYRRLSGVDLLTFELQPIRHEPYICNFYYHFLREGKFAAYQPNG